MSHNLSLSASANHIKKFHQLRPFKAEFPRFSVRQYVGFMLGVCFCFVFCCISSSSIFTAFYLTALTAELTTSTQGKPGKCIVTMTTSSYATASVCHFPDYAVCPV